MDCNRVALLAWDTHLVKQLRSVTQWSWGRWTTVVAAMIPPMPTTVGSRTFAWAGLAMPDT